MRTNQAIFLLGASSVALSLCFFTGAYSQAHMGHRFSSVSTLFRSQDLVRTSNNEKALCSALAIPPLRNLPRVPGRV